MGMEISRFDVFLALDPTVGSEIKKTRPCVVLSPDEMNVLRTIIVAPMTTNGFEFPTRVHAEFSKKKGFIVLDQIRSVDKSRLIKKLGKLDTTTANKVLNILQEMFSE